MSRLGIIAALPTEAKCLYSKKLNLGLPIEIHKDIFLCLSGIGHEHALNAANKLLTLKVDALVSWGVAGAIDKSLKSGDLLIANEIINQNARYSTSGEWLSNLLQYLERTSNTVMQGSLASSNDICASATDKYNLFEQTGALAVDMESATIAEIASLNKLDFMIIRAISDTANTAIPTAVLNHTNHLGQPRLLGFIISCLMKPSQIAEIACLANGFNKGISTLTSIGSELKNKHFFHSAV